MTVTADIAVQPLQPLFAAEIAGIDLAQALSEAQVDAIVRACDRYAVLVFRDQRVNDTQQMAFSARFGPLETSVKKFRPGHAFRLDPHISDISNLDSTGNVLSVQDRNRMYGLGDRLWHTDSSFKAVPAKYSMLSAHAIPDAGGETQFADMRAAYDALDHDTQMAIGNLIAEHSIIYSRSTIGFTDFSEEERRALHPVPQRIVRTHPGSGRKALYLASHAMGVQGMPVPEARLLLRQLIEHATQHDFIYTHHWRVGDVVMWDDRCTMHRARPYDMRQRRDMHRTTVSDAGSSISEPANTDASHS